MSNTDRAGLTHCKFVLIFAVIMDLFGVSTLLIGIFVPLEIAGREFGDLLVYSGAVLMLMSIGAWIMWYSGNIEGLLSGKEPTHKHYAVDLLARTLSRRIRKPHRGHSMSWTSISEHDRKHIGHVWTLKIDNMMFATKFVFSCTCTVIYELYYA